MKENAVGRFAMCPSVRKSLFRMRMMSVESEHRLSGCVKKPVLRSRKGFTVGWERPFRHMEEPFLRDGRGSFAWQ
ncbi:hypothetical protein [Leyella lascolaii]|uniref:hypothetical protein n=1 Tax=Leyella lascolaii TaxID=1776379 RepID=UPI00083A4FEA|nr:hypothetical protein [Leyella lascolaii]